MVRDSTKSGLERGLTTYGDQGFARYLRRSFAKSMGYSDEMLNRPIVGICYTPSGFNNCHRHFPDMLEAVKRGVLAEGALPLPFPVISLGETFLAPTSFKFRNLMAMDVEEMIRAQPMDAVVLMGGCDKTVPAQLMGAISANVPAVSLVAGPMMTGRYRRERLGACTDCRRYWAQYRGGRVDAEQIAEIENSLAVTAGTCAVMGTASTMACVAEALGMALPQSSTTPAVHANRLRIAEESGRAAARLIGSGRTPRSIVTAPAIENALRVLLALSGSTNAVIHLTAIAARAGYRLTLDDLNRLSDETPTLVDLKPTGEHYMEDLDAAGGLGAVLQELEPLLNREVQSITGETLGERLDHGRDDFVDNAVVRSRSVPLSVTGGLVGLRGSLAPEGALLKRAAATPTLLEHTGRAVVFSSLEDLAERIDSPDLDVQADDILVLQNAGPISPAAMPEAGYLPIPRKLAREGVTDMVRISDARMSGTAYGTVVLHITPEAATGGPLALVRDGDQISLSVSQRSLDLMVDPSELSARRSALMPRPELPERGYDQLFQRSITDASHGCDFDFLQPRDLRPLR